MPVPSTPPQWYDEAKDKLMPTDAGKPVDVYQYYGSNRTNDPSKLADHDVVITTYGTLTADKGAVLAEATSSTVNDEQRDVLVAAEDVVGATAKHAARPLRSVPSVARTASPCFGST